MGASTFIFFPIRSQSYWWGTISLPFFTTIHENWGRWRCLPEWACVHHNVISFVLWTSWYPR
jgi:hypothetical protein